MLQPTHVQNVARIDLGTNWLTYKTIQMPWQSFTPHKDLGEKEAVHKGEKFKISTLW